jgi:hypothetical protein
MSDFGLWFVTGLQHIADLKGYDHMLYLLALCGIYEFRDAKRLLVLITAFTVGHSITLMLSTLDAIRVNTAWIEFLIPFTIVITALSNITKSGNPSLTSFRLRYAGALFFGLIHGMGFSFLLKSMLGSEEQILMPLFAFNLGIETGQILIVTAVLLFSLLLTSIFSIARETWNFFISSAVFGIAFIMTAERFAMLFN